MTDFELYYGKQFHKYPKDILNDGLCKFYVEYYWANIKYVPNDLLTKEICEIALNKNYKAFEFIPEKHMNVKMIEKVLEDGKGRFFEIIPDVYKTKEICTLAVKLNNNNLEFVPEDIKDYEFCTENLNIYSEAVKFVPERFIDTNLIKKLYPNLKIKITSEIKRKEDKMEIEIVNRRLDLIISLKEGQTISAYYETVMEHDSYYTSFWRSYSGDNRHNTLDFIRSVFDLAKAYRYIPEVKQKFSQALKKEAELKATYKDSEEFCQNISDLFEVYRKIY